MNRSMPSSSQRAKPPHGKNTINRAAIDATSLQQYKRAVSAPSAPCTSSARMNGVAIAFRSTLFPELLLVD